MPTLLVGVTLLAVLVGFEHFVPRVPAPLVAIALAIAASGLLGLDAAGRGDGRPRRRRPAEPGAAARRAGPGDVAGGGRDRPHELHRDDRRGARVRRPRTSRGPSPIRNCSRSAWPTPRAACWARCPRAAAPRRRPSIAWPARARKSPALVTAAAATRHAPAARPGDRADAAGSPGGRRRGLLARAHQAGRVRRHPTRTRDGAPLGPHCVRRRGPARHAQGHPGGRRRVAAGAGAPGLQSGRLCSRPQARDHGLPPAHGGPPRR